MYEDGRMQREEWTRSYGEGNQLFLVALPFQTDRRHGETPEGWQVKGCSRWARKPLCFWCLVLAAGPLSPCQGHRYHPHPWLVQQLCHLGHVPGRSCWRPASCKAASTQLMALQQDMSLPETQHPPPGMRCPAFPSLPSVKHDLQSHHLPPWKESSSIFPVTAFAHFISWLKLCFSHSNLHLQLTAAKTVSREEAQPRSP